MKFATPLLLRRKSESKASADRCPTFLRASRPGRKLLTEQIIQTIQRNGTLEINAGLFKRSIPHPAVVGFDFNATEFEGAHNPRRGTFCCFTQINMYLMYMGNQC